MKNNPIFTNAVVAIVAAVIAGGTGFYIGKMPQFSGANITNSTGSQNGQYRTGQNFRGGQGGNFSGGTGARNSFAGRGAMGEVTSVDDKSLTVKMPDGSSKIVLFSDKTIFENTTTAKRSDISTGKTVRVLGTTNSDGSITADNIDLNPTTFNFMRTATPSALPKQ
jgi:hypothetical protein